MIHPLADVQSTSIGNNTDIWQFAVICYMAVIGNECNINSHVFIENDVLIGNRVTIKCGVQIWDGMIIEDDVFIGPNTTFTNDNNPISKNKDYTLLKTHIKKGASIGANCTILPGITIGENAMVGAGTIVTKDVLPNTTVYNRPELITRDN